MALLNIVVLTPYLLGFYNLKYLIAIIIGVIFPNSYCIIYFKKHKKQYDYNHIQKTQKMITIFGLFIILLMEK